MKAILVPKAWQGYLFNVIQPQQTVEGRVLDKWSATVRGMDALAADDGYIRTDYFVTLQLQHGERKEFSVDADAYGQLNVGDSGGITYQGNWLLRFALHSERGWEVIQSQPQSERVWGFVVVSVVVVFLFLSMMTGCGGDETKPPDPDPDPDAAESLVGTWKVDRINDQSLADYFSTPEAGIQAEVTANEWVFASEGWFAHSIGFKFRSDLGDGVSLTLSMASSIKGKYTVEGQRLSQVIEDVSVTLSPKDTWEALGVSEEAYAKDLRKDILESGTWSLLGDTLTLTDDSGEKIVLQRQTAQP